MKTVLFFSFSRTHSKIQNRVNFALPNITMPLSGYWLECDGEVKNTKKTELQNTKKLNYKIQKIQMCRLTGQDHQRRPRQQAQCSRRRGQRGSGRGTLGHTRHTAQCALLLATAPSSLHLQYCKLLLNVFSLE